jgi:hypothetical protein
MFKERRNFTSIHVYPRVGFFYCSTLTLLDNRLILWPSNKTVLLLPNCVLRGLMVWATVSEQCKRLDAKNENTSRYGMVRNSARRWPKYWLTQKILNKKKHLNNKDKKYKKDDTYQFFCRLLGRFSDATYAVNLFVEHYLVAPLYFFHREEWSNGNVSQQKLKSLELNLHSCIFIYTYFPCLNHSLAWLKNT